MPKEVLNISEFTGGMSTAFDSKDLADNVLHQSWGFDFSTLGTLKMIGGMFNPQVPIGQAVANWAGDIIPSGYGLYNFPFAFPQFENTYMEKGMHVFAWGLNNILYFTTFHNDEYFPDLSWNIEGAIGTSVDWLINQDLWGDNTPSSGNVYNMHSIDDDGTITLIEEKNIEPVYYYVDGVLRCNDGNFNNIPADPYELEYSDLKKDYNNGTFGNDRVYLDYVRPLQCKHLWFGYINRTFRKSITRDYLNEVITNLYGSDIQQELVDNQVYERRETQTFKNSYRESWASNRIALFKNAYFHDYGDTVPNTDNTEDFYYPITSTDDSDDRTSNQVNIHIGQYPTSESGALSSSLSPASGLEAGDPLIGKWRFGVSEVLDGTQESSIIKVGQGRDNISGDEDNFNWNIWKAETIEESRCYPHLTVWFCHGNKEYGGNVGNSESTSAHLDVSPRVTHYRVYVTTQEDIDVWSLLAEIDLEEGITRYWGCTKKEQRFVPILNPDEYGGTPVDNLDMHSLWVNARYDSKGDGFDDMVFWTSLPPLSYEALNGFESRYNPLKNRLAVRSEGANSPRYKCAVVHAGRTFLGNVMVGDNHFPDKILVSPPGQYDIFPYDGLHEIYVTSGQGDKIIELLSYKDKLVVLNTNSIHVLNVTELKESIVNPEVHNSFYYNGINSKSQACLTRHGVVWANQYGVFLYTDVGSAFAAENAQVKKGEPINLIENRFNVGERLLFEDDWETTIHGEIDYELKNWASFFNSNSQTFPDSSGVNTKPFIGYDARADKLFIFKSSNLYSDDYLNNGNAFIFDFISKTWTFSSNFLPCVGGLTDSQGDILGSDWFAYKSNAITAVNGRMYTSINLRMYGQNLFNGHLNYFLNQSKYNYFPQIITKTFDFGAPASDKKIYKIKITFKTRGFVIDDNYSGYSGAYIYAQFNNNGEWIKLDDYKKSKNYTSSGGLTTTPTSIDSTLITMSTTNNTYNDDEIINTPITPSAASIQSKSYSSVFSNNNIDKQSPLKIDTDYNIISTFPSYRQALDDGFILDKDRTDIFLEPINNAVNGTGQEGSQVNNINIEKAFWQYAEINIPSKYGKNVKNMQIWIRPLTVSNEPSEFSLFSTGNVQHNIPSTNHTIANDFEINDIQIIYRKKRVK